MIVFNSWILYLRFNTTLTQKQGREKRTWVTISTTWYWSSPTVGCVKNTCRVAFRRCFHLAIFIDSTDAVLASELSDSICCAERNLLNHHPSLPRGIMVVVQVQRKRRGRLSFGESLPCSRCHAAILDNTDIISSVVWSQRGSHVLAQASPDCLPEAVMTAFH